MELEGAFFIAFARGGTKKNVAHGRHGYFQPNVTTMVKPVTAIK